MAERPFLQRIPRPVRNAGYATVTLLALGVDAACGGSKAENGNSQTGEVNSSVDNTVDVMSETGSNTITATPIPEAPKSIEEKMLSVENCKAYASVQERDAAVANTVKEMQEAVAFATTNFKSAPGQNAALKNSEKDIEVFKKSYLTLDNANETSRTQHLNNVAGVFQSYGDLNRTYGSDQEILEAGSAIRCAITRDVKTWIGQGYYTEAQLSSFLNNIYKVAFYQPPK